MAPKTASGDLINALVATEDERFYEHSGIDFRGTVRAIVKLGRDGGGSTITQQLAKLLFHGEGSRNLAERIFQKVKEYVIATRLERQYTKQEIITMYLNKYDFLNQAVGIRSASRIYFGKEPIDLNNDGTESINFLNEMDCYNNETIVFNADNSGIAMSTSYALFEIFIETGTTDSFDFTIDCIAEVENTDITWTQSGNLVSITDSFNETTEWTLVGNTLSITFPEGFSVTDPDDTAVTVTQDLTFVYTKQ